ncbi:NADAR family protein [Psychrobacter sp. UBA3480]|uniref:NADAR family protein n=1 Tax=Psychrobacter sp. UBA3480 TaxID=1947350 RepID=UPI0025E2BBC5|nr:NADAR family protein [Psychrobacter sp. UBA3480]
MIKRFADEYRWASNFAACDVVLDDVVYPSVEHAYVAAKTINTQQRLDLLDMTAGEAKRVGRAFDIREDWLDIKIAVMTDLLNQKFSQQPFKELLLATGDEIIIEGNWWGDLFWGMNLECTEGENNLGKLLMSIRSRLQNSTGI